MTDLFAPDTGPSDHDLLHFMIVHLTAFADLLADHYAQAGRTAETTRIVYRMRGVPGYRFTLTTSTPGVVLFSARCSTATALGYLMDYLTREYVATVEAVSLYHLRGECVLLDPELITRTIEGE